MEDLSPSDVIEASWLETYERLLNVIWHQLIELNRNLFLIRRIENFPFNVFMPAYANRIFWHLTRNALIEKSIMIIWRVVMDTDSDSLTLRYFKNQIFEHLCNKDVEKRLRKDLKENGFENKITQLKSKIKNARHYYLAHLNTDALINPDSQKIQETINLTELDEILVISQELFDLLSFGNGHGLWYVGYLDSQREKQETDIDRLLDSVARESAFLNMPERDPVGWEIRKSQYSETALSIINAYRRKFGLNEV